MPTTTKTRKPRNTRKPGATKPEATAIANVPALPVTDIKHGEIIAPGASIKADAGKAEKPDAKAKHDERVSLIAVDRAAIAALYSGFDANRQSVPVKAVSARFRAEPVEPHPIARRPSARQCAALVVGLAANGVKLADGATFNRTFAIGDTQSTIENGVLRDARSSGLVSDATVETVTLGKNAATIISGLLGEKLLRSAKLI